MFLSFRMGQAAEGPARGQRLCDIDPEELVNHVSKNREVLARRKYTDYNTETPVHLSVHFLIFGT